MSGQIEYDRQHHMYIYEKIDPAAPGYNLPA
jgi:hypothetical protein